MKKLLIILLTLFTLSASAQTPDTVRIKVHGGSGGGISESKIAQMISDSLATLDLSGYTKDQVDSITTVIRSEIASSGITQTQLDDSTSAIREDIPDTSTFLKKGTYFPLNVIAPLYPVDSFTAGVDSLYILKRVPTISALQNDTSKATMIMVTDTLQGGVFIYSSASNMVDNGVVFDATGKGSGYWVRQYDKSKGVNVDWWGTRTEAAINSAEVYAGINGIINFTPNRTYTLSDKVSAISGITFNGNNATLLRANGVRVTTTADASTTQPSVTFSSIPTGWKVNDYIYLFYDTTSFSASAPLAISSISGNTVTFSSNIGGIYTTNTEHVQITTWPSGTFAIKSYSMIDDNHTAINFKIKDLIFDGNKSNNNFNTSWLINSTIIIHGTGNAVIQNCQFYNIPNENIIGHGFNISNNYAKNLNGSFVHMSETYTLNPPLLPSIISGNITDSTNLIQNTVGGHSQGVITFSNTAGFLNIENNRFTNGNDAVFGFIQGGNSADAGPTKNLIITGNYAKNFNKIFYNTLFAYGYDLMYKPGHIYIANNIFDSCKTTDWSSFQIALNTLDTIMVGNNLLVGGTVWKVPVLNSDSSQRYILNNQTSTPQGGDINITGKVTANSNIFSTYGDITANAGKITSGSDSATNNYFNLAGSPTDNTFLVFNASRKYPKIALNDTYPGGSSFTLWNLGNTLRVGTNTSTQGLSAWYTVAGNAGNVGFNGSILYNNSPTGTINDSLLTWDASSKTIRAINGSLKANDASVVHLAGPETITGQKTYSSYALFSNGAWVIGNNSGIYSSSTTYGVIIAGRTGNDGMTWQGGSDPTYRNIPLVLHNAAGSVVARGAGSQTADILQIQDSAKNILSSFNSLGMFSNKGANVSSASAIVPTGQLFHVTGTTNITSITATNVKAGTSIKIIFDGVLTLTDGNNLKLAGNFTTSADATITLVYDGTNFYETSRSTN